MAKRNRKGDLFYFMDDILTNHYQYYRIMTCKPIVYKRIEDKRIEIDIDMLYSMSCIKITLLFNGLFMFDKVIDTTCGRYSDIKAKASETLYDMNTIIQSLEIGGYLK